MYRSYYKYCIVPQCKSTSSKTPEKLFIYVPKNPQIRKKWLKLARRDGIHRLSSKSKMYFCEDHFDLPNDMLNYTQYRIMGKVSQVQMKPGCSPSKFECQEDRRKRTCSSVRPYMLKKQRKAIIAECLNESYESYTPRSSVGLDACVQDPLRKIIGQCRFCGETNKKCIDVAYLPYLNKSKTSIAFNDISIQLDFSSTVLPNSVCDDCNIKLQEMRDFIILVQEAQENFQVETKSNTKKAKKTVTRNHTDDEDTNDPFENKRSIRNDNDDVNTSLAFEGEDLQIEYEPMEPKEGSNECQIKIEYESDDNDNKEEIVDSLTIEEPVFFKETHKKIVDTAKRKAEMKTEKFVFDMNIKKEVMETDNTNEEAPEISASGVSASSSVDYITIDGTTGTLSVEQGNKRKKKK